jgi:hypothetical protein
VHKGPNEWLSVAFVGGLNLCGLDLPERLADGQTVAGQGGSGLNAYLPALIGYIRQEAGHDDLGWSA